MTEQTPVPIGGSPQNDEFTVYASEARTATPTATDYINHDHRGVVIFVDCTAIAASPSVVFTVQGKSSLSGEYWSILASAAVVGAGNTTLKVYPGITAAANASASDVLPRIWKVAAVHGDADSITYSVTANYIV